MFISCDLVSHSWSTIFASNILQEEDRWLRHGKICSSVGAFLPWFWCLVNKKSTMGWNFSVRGGKGGNPGHYSCQRSWRAPLRCGKAVQSMFSSSLFKCWIVTKPPAFTLNPLIPHRIWVPDHQQTEKLILPAFWPHKWGRKKPQRQTNSLFVQYSTFRITSF